MKFSLIRPASMLAMAVALASCGGGGDDDDFTVAGSVDGIVYPGMVLTNNGADISVAPPAKAGDRVQFSFPNKLEYGDTYAVTIKSMPQHQVCDIHREAPMSATGTAGQLASINVRFECGIQAHNIGGTVTGLTKDNTGLVLANGSTSGTTLIVPADTNTTGAAFPYAMVVQVPYNQTYGVTIVTQPKGAVCTVQNPTGVMGDVDITNINITCVQS